MADMNIPVTPPKRPTSLTVMGVLGIVFSGLGLLGVLGSCAGSFCLQSVYGNLLKTLSSRSAESLSDGTAGLLSTARQFIQIMTAYMIIVAAAGLVTGIIGLIGSIGLVSDKRWSKGLCTAYACLLFGTGIGGTVANVVFLNPLLEKFMDAARSYVSSAAMYGNPFYGVYEPGFQLVSSVAGGILGCVFPALMLVFINTPKAKIYFTALRHPAV